MIVTEKYDPNNTATVLYWDTIQQGVGNAYLQFNNSPENCFQLACCGSSGPPDWASSIYNGYQENMKEIGIGAAVAVKPYNIPLSCCRSVRGKT